MYYTFSMTIIILAAGLSKRMGEDKNKLLLPFRGKTIIDSTISQALTVSRNIIVVLGHEKEKVEAIIKSYPVKIVYNNNYINGQMTSTLTALKAMNLQDDFAIVPADLPLLTREIYLEGIKLLETHEITRPKYKDTYGHPVFLKGYLKEEILKENPESMKAFCNKRGFIAYDSNEYSIFDIDTPAKYKKLLQLG